MWGYFYVSGTGRVMGTWMRRLGGAKEGGGRGFGAGGGGFGGGVILRLFTRGRG